MSRCGCPVARPVAWLKTAASPQVNEPDTSKLTSTPSLSRSLTGVPKRTVLDVEGGRS